MRTSPFGVWAEGGATVYVTSLPDGTDASTWGPITNLEDVFGTSDPNTVLITTTDRVARLDLGTGETTTIGDAPRGWSTV